MKDVSGKLILGKTRWRRFGLSFGIPMVIVFTMLFLLMTAQIALPITISGTQFKVTADSLNTTATENCNSAEQTPAKAAECAFQQFGSVNPIYGTTSGQAVAVTVLKDATLANLTQTVCGAIPGMTGYFLKVVITANPAVATGGMVVDATDLTGNATFTNIQIGVPVTGRAGTTFGQTADDVSITSLAQKAVYTQAGTFTLTGLHLTASIYGGTEAGCLG